MPTYCFKCECGATANEFRSVAQYQDPMICSSCGGKMVIDIAAQHTAARGDYKHPIISDSMGFVADPVDMAEHRRRFPNIDLDVDNGCARPVLRSLGQKRQYLKAMGWIDKNSFS